MGSIPISLSGEIIASLIREAIISLIASAFRILANTAFNSCTTPVSPWHNNRSLTLSSSSVRLASEPFPFPYINMNVCN